MCCRCKGTLFGLKLYWAFWLRSGGFNRVGSCSGMWGSSLFMLFSAQNWEILKAIQKKFPWPKRGLKTCWKYPLILLAAWFPKQCSKQLFLQRQKYWGTNRHCLLICLLALWLAFIFLREGKQLEMSSSLFFPAVSWLNKEETISMGACLGVSAAEFPAL